MKDKLSEARKQLELRRLDFFEHKMEMYEKSQRRKSVIRIIMGMFLGIIVTAAIAFLMWRPIPQENRDVVIVLVSGLSGAFFGSVISYYFGDSDNAVPQSPSFQEEGTGSSSSTEEEDFTSSESEGL